MAQVLDSADQDIKTVILTVLFVKKKIEIWRILEKTQIELLDNKITICEIKDTLGI